MAKHLARIHGTEEDKGENENIFNFFLGHLSQFDLFFSVSQLSLLSQNWGVQAFRSMFQVRDHAFHFSQYAVAH